jgi:hypothetical protein
MRYINPSLVASLVFAPANAFIHTVRDNEVHRYADKLNMAASGAEKAQVKSSDFQVVDPL